MSEKPNAANDEKQIISFFPVLADFYDDGIPLK